MTEDGRIEREKEFHNRPSRSRRWLNRINRPLGSEVVRVVRTALGEVAGLTVLHVGAGEGAYLESLFVARPRQILSFDLAKARVRKARESEHGIFPNRWFVADAHRIPLRPGCVDVAVGIAILHHLDLDRAVDELTRVVRPGGRVIMAEPLAGHPLVAFVRRLTPGARTPDEKPFSDADLRLIGERLRLTKLRYVHILSPVFAPVVAFMPAGLGRRVVAVITKLDSALSRAFPSLRRKSWYVVIAAERP